MSYPNTSKGVMSDIPLNEKQRNPVYKVKKKHKLIEEHDHISSYVEKNLKNIPKPRNKEYR